jgi:O-antigen/teichoic acid export membrane protein
MSSADNNSRSLRKLAVMGASWTMAGYAVSQLLKLGSNLVLTRLLAPEHFGVMAVVTGLMIGLAMFSDIGIGPSIIQNARGEEEEFLNTAWTIQAIRGGLIWLCSIILAWPVSKFYDEPLLFWLLPAIGFISVISGFNATGLFSANRNLALGRLTVIEIGSQIAAIIVMIPLATFYSSVWVLVVGGITSALVKMAASHYWLMSERNRFCWDATAVSELMSFGRWIFVSTILTFFLNSAGSLILGKFMSTTELGLFAIASILSKTVEQVYQQISAKVLFPIYAQIKHISTVEMRKKVFKIRLAIMAAFLPPLWGMTIFGQQIMDLLFDVRYHDAGWMFSVLSAGLIPMVITGIGPFYLAHGDSLVLMKTTIVRFVFYVGAMLMGYALFGVNGIVLGMAGSAVLMYFIEVYLQRLYSIWIFQLDILGIVFSCVIVGIGFWIFPAPLLLNPIP